MIVGLTCITLSHVVLTVAWCCCTKTCRTKAIMDSRPSDSHDAQVDGPLSKPILLKTVDPHADVFDCVRLINMNRDMLCAVPLYGVTSV